MPPLLALLLSLALAWLLQSFAAAAPASIATPNPSAALARAALAYVQ